MTERLWFLLDYVSSATEQHRHDWRDFLPLSVRGYVDIGDRKEGSRSREITITQRGRDALARRSGESS